MNNKLLIVFTKKIALSGVTIKFIWETLVHIHFTILEWYALCFSVEDIFTSPGVFKYSLKALIVFLAVEESLTIPSSPKECSSWLLGDTYFGLNSETFRHVQVINRKKSLSNGIFESLIKLQCRNVWVCCFVSPLQINTTKFKIVNSLKNLFVSRPWNGFPQLKNFKNRLRTFWLFRLFGELYAS